MEATPVVSAKGAAALATSSQRLYVGCNGSVYIYALPGHDLERTIKLNASQIAYVDGADCLAVIENSRAYIYSADLRKRIYEFDSGSASRISANNSTVVLASKRRIRWATQGSDGWKADQLQLPGAKDILIHDDIVYVVTGSQLLAVDLNARRVRQLDFKISPQWGHLRVHMCFANSLVVVAGKKAWCEHEFDLASDPQTIAPLGKFWVLASNSKLELFDGTNVVSSLDLPVISSCDGYVATKTQVYRLETQISVEFIQSVAKNNPKFALSLAQGMTDDKVNDLRLQQAKRDLADQQWDSAISGFIEANVSPETVIEEMSKVLDGIDPAQTAIPSSASSIVSTLSTPDRLIIPQIEAFIPYLTGQRRRLNISLASGEISLEQAKPQLVLIDTTLFQCYFLNKSSLIGALVRNSNHCDPDVVIPKLSILARWRDLVGFLHSRNLHEEALELLTEHGTAHEIILYLERAGSFELIKRFAPAALNKEPASARILFADSDYDPHLVYEFLQSNHSPYTLEYIEEQVKTSDDQVLNQDLASYFLENNMVDRLDKFLRDTDHYSPQELFPRIPSNLYKTQAILYAKMGQHDKVVETYVQRGKFSEAKHHCAEIYDKDASAGTKVLYHLYKIILASHPEELVQFLNSQGHYLDHTKVVEDLPSHLKMSEIESFFGHQSRHIVSQNNNSGLKSTLAQAFLAESTYNLAHLRDQQVSIQQTTTCDFCKKRLGLSVIGLWQGSVLHYGCIDAFRSIY